MPRADCARTYGVVEKAFFTRAGSRMIRAGLRHTTGGGLCDERFVRVRYTMSAGYMGVSRMHFTRKRVVLVASCMAIAAVGLTSAVYAASGAGNGGVPGASTSAA